MQRYMRWLLIFTLIEYVYATIRDNKMGITNNYGVRAESEIDLTNSMMSNITIPNFTYFL